MHYSQWGSGYGMMDGAFGAWGLPTWAPPLFLLMFLWTILWKGLALWRAAKRGDMWWFIAFLFINTLGILEIIYLFLVSGAKLSDFTNGLSNKSHHQ